MSQSREQILRGHEFAGTLTKERSKTRLIIEAGPNLFATGRAISEIYKRKLSKSKESLNELDSVILIESAQPCSANYKWQNFLRLIPSAGSIEIVYTGLGSFLGSVLPLVLIGRFFGKKVSLFYYPGESIDGTPGWFHRAVLTICDSVYVASRFLQRQLLRNRIESKFYLPPCDARIYEIKEIVSLQPSMLVVEPGGQSAGLFTLLKAFELVKQKYPRAELIVLTHKKYLLELLICPAMRTLNGVDCRALDDSDSLRKSFAGADLFINCSFSESISIPMICAMSAGLPVISFETSGSRELIEHNQNGILVKHNDVGGLAGAIIDLIESPETVAKISSEAKKSPKP
ncbi:MAG: glycosyltransferase family 4 protein [candidate division Zixibacteria bacterium]|nr:glycosyltransferase family 4 protein [candidate division Zixibacteria bacterium]